MWTSGHEYEHVGRAHGYECRHLDTGMDMHVTDMGIIVHIDSQTQVRTWTPGHGYGHAGHAHGYECGHPDTGMNLQVVATGMNMDIWTRVWTCLP